jgi:methyl-accepting chemotaxis protein
MQLLSHLRLRTKLAALIGLSALAIVALLGIASSMLRQHRIDKVRAVALEARSFAQSLERQVTAGRITRDQAMATFRDQLHTVRYGDGDDYLLAQTYDGPVVMHGGDARREGKPTTAKDAAGHSSADLAREALRDADTGVIRYQVAKPGQAPQSPKISFVARFPPWQLDFITGAWIDDIDASFRASVVRLSLIGAAILVATLLVSVLIERDIAVSLGTLRTVMAQFAHGNLSAGVPGIERRDEVGAMAQAVVVFKDAMLRADRAGG